MPGSLSVRVRAPKLLRPPPGRDGPSFLAAQPAPAAPTPGAACWHPRTQAGRPEALSPSPSPAPTRQRLQLSGLAPHPPEPVAPFSSAALAPSLSSRGPRDRQGCPVCGRGRRPPSEAPVQGQSRVRGCRGRGQGTGPRLSPQWVPLSVQPRPRRCGAGLLAGGRPAGAGGASLWPLAPPPHRPAGRLMTPAGRALGEPECEVRSVRSGVFSELDAVKETPFPPMGRGSSGSWRCGVLSCVLPRGLTSAVRTAWHPLSLATRGGGSEAPEPELEPALEPAHVGPWTTDALANPVPSPLLLACERLLLAQCRPVPSRDLGRASVYPLAAAPGRERGPSAGSPDSLA